MNMLKTDRNDGNLPMNDESWSLSSSLFWKATLNFMFSSLIFCITQTKDKLDKYCSSDGIGFGLNVSHTISNFNCNSLGLKDNLDMRHLEKVVRKKNKFFHLFFCVSWKFVELEKSSQRGKSKLLYCTKDLHILSRNSFYYDKLIQQIARKSIE